MESQSQGEDTAQSPAAEMMMQGLFTGKGRLELADKMTNCWEKNRCQDRAFTNISELPSNICILLGKPEPKQVKLEIFKYCPNSIFVLVNLKCETNM